MPFTPRPRMRRLRSFWPLLAIALGYLAPAAAADRPANVILILVDDQGYGDLSCHGNPVVKTPHLDALHADAVRLTDYHASPFCSPTRASLLTGRHCRSVGVLGLNGIAQHMAVEPRTMAEMFAAAGYATGIFGKWHLGDRWPLRPMDRGFAESVVFPDGAVSTVPDHWGNDYVDDTYLENGRPKKFAGYCTDVWFDLAIDFVTRHRDRPFLCYLPTNAAHAPYLAPDEFVAPYRGAVPDPVARFYGMIANLDANVGRLRGRLAELGLDRDTIIVFTTDNGTAAGRFNAGMRGGKGSSFDGGHRVPCFVRYPAGGVAGGRDVAALAAHLDVLPTLLDLCGVDPGAGRPPFDGSSLAPVLAGTATPPADRVLVESYQHIVLTERWRLVEGTKLYDIEADPAQERDVAAAHPDVVARLNEALAAVRAAEDVRPHHVTVGGAAQDPVTLTGEDWPTKPAIYQYWMSGATPWAETQVWQIAVHRPGRYRVALRRWPRETATAINAALPREKWCHAMQTCEVIAATRAHLRLGDREEAVAVTDDLEEAVFTVDLPAGPATLQGWFTGAAPGRWAARYVEVSRLGDPPAAAAAPAYTVAEVPAGSVRVDGALDEPAWGRAEVERGFTLPWERAEPPATTFRAVRDAESLWFAFEVVDPTPVVVADGTDERAVARGDRVELFFAADAALDRYVCVEIDPQGRVLDYAAQHYRVFDYPWSFPRGLQVAAVRTPDGYRVEGAIPWAALEELGLPSLPRGGPLRVGIFRADFRRAADGTVEEHWISWVDPRLPTADFHVPGAFGTWR